MLGNNGRAKRGGRCRNLIEDTNLQNGLFFKLKGRPVNYKFRRVITLFYIESFSEFHRNTYKSFCGVCRHTHGVVKQNFSDQISKNSFTNKTTSF